MLLVSKKILLSPNVGKTRGSEIHRMAQRTMCTEANIEERKINIGDVNINYARVGSGEHPILLLPGVLGTIWSDFKPQIEGLSRDKFTLVAWDPPGHGKSRPPDRTFPDCFWERDAGWARDLMRTLGYSKFSLLGWSDGAITSLFMASAYPDEIRSMVAVAGKAYFMLEEMEIYCKMRDVGRWSEKMRETMLAIYDEEYFRKTWADCTDAVLRHYEEHGGDICKGRLSKIKCSTLIVHGAFDIFVPPAHANYLQERIQNAKLKIIDFGLHHVQLKHAEVFNALVTDFFFKQ